MISRFDGMYEQLVEITTPSGAMETFITRPQDGGPFAPVILYMDIWGVREELYDIARKVAAVGYCCLVPDLYHRQGRVRHAFYDDNGRMITLESLSEERKELVRAPGRELRDDMRDVEHARARSFGASGTGRRTGLLHGRPARVPRGGRVSGPVQGERLPARLRPRHRGQRLAAFERGEIAG